MELKDFIKGTLTEIITAVVETQEELKSTGAEINPYKYGKIERTKTGEGSPIYHIEFDIAVTTSDTAGAKGGIGVFVAGLGIGTKGEMTEANTAQNRIKFQIPIALPLSKMHMRQN
jgi:hypothetical protein